MALITLSSVANAVTVTLVSHNQTSGSGAISSLITDGSAFYSSQTASTAVWDWDGTTLSATGLYNAVGTIGSSPYGASILEDSIDDLSINSATFTATGTSYACLEGTFLSTVGASGCGGYQFGSKMMDESTTTWGPGLAFDRTIGGNDILTGPQRSISAYDFDTFTATGGNLEVGNGIALGGDGELLGPAGGELMTFSIETSVAPDFPPSVRANETLTIDVLANDDLLDDITDLTTTTPGTTIVMGLPGPQAGVSIDFKSAIGFSGDASFDYTVTDGSDKPGLTTTVTVTVTNLLPSATDKSAGTLVDTPVNIDILSGDILGDGPDSIVDVTIQPLNGMVTSVATGTLPVTCAVSVDCSLTYTPGPGYIGPDTFTYSLTDDNGDIDTAIVSITVADKLTAIADFPATEKNIPVDIDVLGNDVGLVSPDFSVDELVAPLTGAVTTPVPITCTIPVGCSLTYAPGLDEVGLVTFEYSVTDALTASDSAMVTIFINDIPVAVDDPANSLPEPLPETATDLDVQANDTEGRNDAPITVTVVNQPANGVTAVNGGGMVTYTSDPGYNGSDSFTYELTDSLGIGIADTSNEATVDIIVNDIPLANDNGTLAAPAYTIPEGTTLSLDVLTNDTGLTDSPLTVTIPTQPVNGSTATPTGSPGVAGAIAVNYAAGLMLGDDFFEYQIEDKSGNTDSAMVFVTVIDPDIPTAINDADQTVVDVPVSTNVLANDTGLADEPLVVTITMPPGSGTLGTFMPACAAQATCLIPYTPNAGFIGDDTYQYLVTDATSDVSNIATVTITVTDQPVAVDDADSINAGQTSMVNVLANDSGLSDTPLVVTVTTPPTNGSIGAITACDGLLPVADCRVSYTPNAGFAGDDTYQYTVTDVDGDNATATVTITVVALPPNDIPRAVFDEGATFSGETVAVDVLANDTGLNDAPLEVTIKSGPSNGSTTNSSISGCTIQGAFCAVTYIPNAGFSGTDTYQYQVKDVDGDSSIATVQIVVTEVPVARDDAATTPALEEVVIDVLANDDGKGNTPLTVTITSTPDLSIGDAVVDGANNIVYTSLGKEPATATFDYTVTDANGKSSTARVTVTITALTDDSQFKDSSSAVGPAGIGLLMMLLPWLRRRNRSA